MSMRPELQVYLDRLRMQAFDARDFTGIPRWLCNHTAHPDDPDRPWSFFEHEYQVEILSDDAPEISMQKCSQVGASEIWVRMMLAMMAISKKITVIYILPTTAMAKRFSQGRINPVLTDSNTLKSMIDKNLDNNEQKRIGRSLLYIAGTFGKVAAISVPAQALFRDEVDFCNQRVLTTFDSRIGHSKEGSAIKRSFSTPTVFKYGINLLFEEGSQGGYALLCPHCFRWVKIDYFRDVVIPGFDGTLREFEKNDLFNPMVKIDQAHFLCPECRHTLHSKDFFDPDRRRWIHDFPSRKDHHSYQVLPIDVPQINPLPRTLRQINDYDNKKDWINYKVGLPFEDAESSFLEERMIEHAVPVHFPKPEDEVFTMPMVRGTYLGMDVGKTNWLTITVPNDRGDVDAIYYERIRQDGDNYAGKRAMFLFKIFGCVCGVVDAGPDISLAAYMVKEGKGRIFACRYDTANPKTLRTLDVLTGKDDEEGLVKVNRNALYDNMVRRVNRGATRLTSKSAEYELVRKHLKAFKRIETKDVESGEINVQWVATGDDHYCHSLGYADVARRIIAVPVQDPVTPHIPTVGCISMGKKDEDDRSRIILPSGFIR